MTKHAPKSAAAVVVTFHAYAAPGASAAPPYRTERVALEGTTPESHATAPPDAARTTTRYEVCARSASPAHGGTAHVNRGDVLTPSAGDGRKLQSGPSDDPDASGTKRRSLTVEAGMSPCLDEACGRRP